MGVVTSAMTKLTSRHKGPKQEAAWSSFQRMGLLTPVAVLSSTGRSKACSGIPGAKLLGATLIATPVSTKIVAQLSSPMFLCWPKLFLVSMLGFLVS